MSDIMEQAYTKKALGSRIKEKANMKMQDDLYRANKRSLHTKGSTLRDMTIRN